MSKQVKQMQMDVLRGTFKDVRDMVFLNVVGLNAIADNQIRLGLRKKGIRADLVVAVDTLNVSYHFEGAQAGDIGTLLLGASVDPANVRSMVRAVFPDRLDPALLQPIIDVAAKYGAIKAPFPASELYSPSAYVPKR